MTRHLLGGGAALLPYRIAESSISRTRQIIQYKHNLTKHGMDTARENVSKLVRYISYILFAYRYHENGAVHTRFYIDISYLSKYFLLPSVCDTPMICLVSEVFTVSPVEGW